MRGGRRRRQAARRLIDDRAPGSRADSAAEVIRSHDNRTLKLVRSLRRRDIREAERAFIVEGFRAIGDALACGAFPRALLVREGDPDLSGRLELAKLPAGRIRTVAASLFDALADTVSPQGILGVFSIPDLTVDDRSNPLVLVLDQIRDPGNVGTLLRAAVGAGVTRVLLTQGAVDPYNPKVVRAGMGAHFRVPIDWLTNETRHWLLGACPIRVLAEAGANQSYDEIDWTGAVAIIIGSEATGVSADVRLLATAAGAIPLAANLESLNAAIAGSVMMFEAARQRRNRLRQG